MTIVEYLDALGSGMDKGVATAFHKILQKQGLNFKLGTKVNSAVKDAASGLFKVELEAVKGGAKETVYCILIG